MFIPRQARHINYTDHGIETLSNPKQYQMREKKDLTNLTTDLFLKLSQCLSDVILMIGMI